MIPLAAVLLNVAMSLEGRCLEPSRLEWPSEPGGGAVARVEGRGDVDEREIECLLQDFDDPEGDVFLFKGVTLEWLTSSSVMTNSASVRSGLSCLSAGTTVSEECSDSAIGTG